MLPPFTPEGLLPPGVYELTIPELLASSLIIAPPGRGAWNAEWRRRLVEGLAVLVGHLVQVGVNEIFIDGSFAEAKEIPNDIDGYFVVDRARWLSGDVERALAALDSCWTWEHDLREQFRRYPKPQLPMWHEYRVELFPDFGQPCGVRDVVGRMLTFVEAFRQSRSFAQKGIIKIGGLS